MLYSTCQNGVHSSQSKPGHCISLPNSNHHLGTAVLCLTDTLVCVILSIEPQHNGMCALKVTMCAYQNRFDYVIKLSTPTNGFYIILKLSSPMIKKGRGFWSYYLHLHHSSAVIFPIKLLLFIARHVTSQNGVHAVLHWNTYSSLIASKITA